MLKNSDPKNLAHNILKLSDFFIENPASETPWNEPWAQEAYLNYFHPLNLERITSVFQEATSLGFFKDLDHFIDFGAGLGAATQAFLNLEPSPSIASTLTSPTLPSMHMVLIEKSQQAQDLAKKMFPPNVKLNWHQQIPDTLKKKSSNKSVFVFSYSFTEIETLPKEALLAEALVFLEPSTRQDGRNLMSLRSQLIQKGFYIWAPCVHQNDCPLLTQSKSDWCHHRIKYEAPQAFRSIEEYLPMKNKTLTYSYLLARKTQPPEHLKSKTRVIGDILDEKGKTRVAICKGSEREYLSWLKRNKAPFEIQRGQLIELPTQLEKKGNELRIVSCP
ncbi:MAG TPA: small ribosomal subunit Rsm22 family protein [Pseudobdellovibrionaceae bacterium]|nr:small ribosomal subunit Rsm22 family protein [Pseudobdellovibrionaceae bacterium]